MNIRGMRVGFVMIRMINILVGIGTRLGNPSQIFVNVSVPMQVNGVWFLRRVVSINTEILQINREWNEFVVQGISEISDRVVFMEC